MSCSLHTHQVRVVQGKEPPCFLSLFDGTMTVHIGKREDETTTSSGPWRLYIVRNEFEHETSLLELPCCASSLRSRGTLLLLNGPRAAGFLWHGANTGPHYRRRAKEITDALRKSCPPEMSISGVALGSVTEVEEGAESDEFWKALRATDRSSYDSQLRNKDGSGDHTMRLFHMSSVSGEFEATEVLNPLRNNANVPCAFPMLQSDLYKVSQPGTYYSGLDLFLLLYLTVALCMLFLIYV